MAPNGLQWPGCVCGRRVGRDSGSGGSPRAHWGRQSAKAGRRGCGKETVIHFTSSLFILDK